MTPNRTTINSFLRRMLDLLYNTAVPEEASRWLKKFICEILPGYNVFILNPEGDENKNVLAADYYMPTEWLNRMISIYGQTALIEPDPESGEDNFFSAPFIWLSLDFGEASGSALVIVPNNPGTLPEAEAINLAGDLKLFIEFILVGHTSNKRNCFVLKGDETALQKVAFEKKDLVKEMDRAVRDPLNTIIGYSMLLLDGSVGPLSDSQSGFVQDILDGGYVVLKHIEDFREKIMLDD